MPELFAFRDRSLDEVRVVGGVQERGGQFCQLLLQARLGSASRDSLCG